jgi:hypothetical protein
MGGQEPWCVQVNIRTGNAESGANGDYAHCVSPLGVTRKNQPLHKNLHMSELPYGHELSHAEALMSTAKRELKPVSLPLVVFGIN